MWRENIAETCSVCMRVTAQHGLMRQLLQRGHRAHAVPNRAVPSTGRAWIGKSFVKGALASGTQPGRVRREGREGSLARQRRCCQPEALLSRAWLGQVTKRAKKEGSRRATGAACPWVGPSPAGLGGTPRGAGSGRTSLQAQRTFPGSALGAV